MPIAEITKIISDLRFFVLVAFRIGGMVMLAPFFGNKVIPRKIKVAMVVAVAAVIFPAVDRAGVRVPDNMGGYLSAALAEVAVGAIIGFAALLILSAVQLGSFIADQQIGLAIAHVFDPSSGEETSLLSQLFYSFAVLVFILVGGHHMLLRMLAVSYDAIPVSRLHLGESALNRLSIGMFSEMFVNAVRISAPAVITLMLVTIVMAIVARTVPEMNIFNIGFAMKLGLGLGVMALFVPALGWISQRLFERMAIDLEFLINEMRPVS